MERQTAIVEPAYDVPAVVQKLHDRFGVDSFVMQHTCDGIPTLWVDKEQLVPVLRYLKHYIDRPFAALYDLTGIDERVRVHRAGQPDSTYTVVYHLLSYHRSKDIRLKVALPGDNLSIPSVTDIWPAANWYEREAWGYVRN